MINAHATKAELFVQSTVEADAFGGFTSTLQSIGFVNAYVTQTKETLSVENGKTGKRVVTKLYTTEAIPHNVTQVKCNGFTYDVLNFVDHKHAITMELVEVQNG